MHLPDAVYGPLYRREDSSQSTDRPEDFNLTFSGGKRPYVDEMSNGNKLSNNYKDVRMTKKKRAD